MRRFTLLTTLCLVSVASARQEPPATPPPPTAPPPVAEAPLPPVEVTLLEPGAEPRQKLRLKPAAGHEQNARLRLVMSVSTKLGEQDVPAAPMPPITMTMRAKVASVSPEGDITYDMAVTDCRAEDTGAPGLAEMINESLKPMMRVTGRATVSDRGLSKDVNFTMPEDVPAQSKDMLTGMKDQVSQLSAPLPEEAVGIGAKWRGKNTIRAQQLKILQSIVYTLTDVRDGTIYVDMALDQTAPPQPMTGTAIPPGTTMELDSLKSSGDGKAQMPLNGIVPTKLATKVVTDLALTMTQNGAPTKIGQAIKLDMAWEPAEAKESPTATPPTGAAPPPAPGSPPPPPVPPPAQAPPTGPR